VQGGVIRDPPVLLAFEQIGSLNKEGASITPLHLASASFSQSSYLPCLELFPPF
jgi:hypothetical protein